MAYKNTEENDFLFLCFWSRLCCCFHFSELSLLLRITQIVRVMVEMSMSHLTMLANMKKKTEGEEHQPQMGESGVLKTEY
jgi:hypothetical protein